jgi:SAM-dependent methyltransferase
MRSWFTVPGDWRHPKSGRTFAIVRCPECGFGRVNPTPSPEVLAEHYRIAGYYTHGTTQHGQRGGILARVLVKLAGYLDRGVRDRQQFVQANVKGRVLEIGCGTGKLLRALQARGHDVVGIEPDEQALARVSAPFPVYPGTAEELPTEITAQKFDAVVMTHVMEHCTDPARVVSNIRHQLNPNGIAIIETPNVACLDFKVGKLSWPHLGVPRHLLFWTSDTLTRLFRQHGFTTEIHYSGLQRQFSPNWIAFGQPMQRFYPVFSLKRLGPIYYGALLAALPLLPKRLRYDSVYIVARR